MVLCFKIVKMTEIKEQTLKWKKHEIEENIGYDKCKYNTSMLYYNSFEIVQI